MIEFFLKDVLVYVEYTAHLSKEPASRGWEIFIDKVMLCKGPKMIDIKDVLPDSELKAIEEKCFSLHPTEKY